MNDVLLSVEGISIYTLSAFVFLAFLWSSFVFYKKAIEYNESEETVFNAVLLMGVLSFVFARLGFVATRLDWFAGHWIRILFVKEYPGMVGWGVFLGVGMGVLIMVKRFKKKLFDWLDLVVLGLSAGVPIVYAARGFLSADLVVGGVIAAETFKGLLLALWFFFLWWAETEYRTFEWYRFRKTQAKAGFVTGVFVLGFGFINLAVDLLLKKASVWYVYTVLVVVGALLVYIRSERKLKKDLKILKKNIKGLSIKKKKIKWLRKKLKGN